MTRDFDLIRSILLQAEAAPAGKGLDQLSFDPPIADAEVAEYITMLAEKGLIVGEAMAIDPLYFHIERLTWEGHDFIEKARNETVWRKVMTQAKTSGAAITIAIVSDLLTREAKRMLGLPTE